MLFSKESYEIIFNIKITIVRNREQ